jgi:hypothetical protein
VELIRETTSLAGSLLLFGDTDCAGHSSYKCRSCVPLGFFFFDSESWKLQARAHPEFFNGWGVNRKAKYNVCWPVAGTLHLGTPETYRYVQLRLFTRECNYTWRDALAALPPQCLMFCVGSSSSQVPEVADFGWKVSHVKRLIVCLKTGVFF